MKKINKKEKILLILTGLILIFFVLKHFVFGPIYENANIYSQEIAMSKALMRRYMALEHNRLEILKAQKQIEGYLSLSGTDEDKAAMVMSRIEAEARKAKLQIQDMNSSGVTKEKGSVTLFHISLRAEGQLKNVLDFLAGLENSNILLQAEKLSLSAKDDSGSVLKIEATILGVAFS
ncbi:MAG: GspMb/PilO family protein [Candidatus Omnitrophica bacterium]|jgi:hypothetical protein|nr:GspMb/PilO family protein [Candidatus Omnitrophota bacterium]